MRVAVIDSGVNPGHPHIVSVAGGVSIAADGTIDRGSYLDRLGHGTAVMAAIQEKAPGAEYYAVKIFHDALRTSSKSLVAAMEWAVDMGVDVINLSLGTKNPAHAALFGPVAERAVAKGCVVVSAYDCYPGCLPGVIGGNLDPDPDRNTYYAGTQPTSPPAIRDPRRGFHASATFRASASRSRIYRGLLQAALFHPLAAILHQGHKAEIHVKLLMAVEQRRAGTRCHHIHFNGLVRRNGNNVLHDAECQFHGVTMQMHRVIHGAAVVEDQTVAGIGAQQDFVRIWPRFSVNRPRDFR